MRVSMLAPFALHPKGTTRWRVLPLARALAAQGHDVQVIVPPYDWPAHGGLRWTDQGVSVLNVPVSGSTVASYVALAKRMAELAVQSRPNVVHCFKPKGPSALAAWLLAQRLPLVMDVDDWELGWNERARYPAAWRLVFRWQEQWGIRQACAVTAASRWLVNFACATRQQGIGRTTVSPESAGVFYLPNGIEADRVLVLGPKANPAQHVLLYTRFVEHTAGDVWQVWRKVLAHSPQARLLVAGRGLHGEERRLATLAERGAAGPSVTLLGWTPSSAMPGLLAAADVAMLPVADTPLNQAKSPMRLVELLAAGLPVATHAVGEYAALVRDGVTGLLAPPGDTGGLAAAMLRLLHDGALRGRLGQAAAQQMQDHYTWLRLSQVALAAYASCDT